MRLVRPHWYLLPLTAALCVACADSTSTPTPGPDAAPPDTTAATTQPPAPPSPPPLTGFFEPGSFATLTVPADTEEGEPQHLSIDNLSVKVTVQGRMARTEVTQVFRNHTARQTEGTYTFTLPEGASVSRLAMDVEGKMMEGELVERERARQIYEQIVRSQKDPALLEWQGGNRFKTQIFPIPASGTKTVALTYEQLLPSVGREARYTYDLPRLEGPGAHSPIKAFTFKLTATAESGALRGEGYALTVTGHEAIFGSEEFRPRGPLSVWFTTEAPQTRVGYGTWKQERFFMIDYVPKLPARQTGARRGLVIALDTSAGIGSRELKRARELASALIAADADAANPGALRIVMGDLDVARCDGVTDRGDLEAARSCLAARQAGGGTDLGKLALEALRAAREIEGATSVVLLTDGVASLGELDGDLMRDAVVKQLDGQDTSLHTVAIGHAPDEDFLTALARAGGGHSVRLTPATSVAAALEALAPRMDEPLVTQLQVSASDGVVEGLVPHHPFNLARGEHGAIMGRLDSDSAVVRVQGSWNGAPIDESFTLTAPKPSQREDLLVNFWARAVIDDMQRGRANRAKIVETSLHYGVMSRYTSFLVLENQEAYERFKVKRRKQAEKERQDQLQKAANLKKSDRDLQEVLQEGEGRDKKKLKREASNMERGEAEDKPMPDPTESDGARGDDGEMPEAKEEEEKSMRFAAQPDLEATDGKDALVGGLGTKGTGRGGGGVSENRFGRLNGLGYGKGDVANLNKRAAATPRVVADRPGVQGALNDEIVRRIVRRHIRELQHCYERQLQRDVALEGRLELRWVVNAQGRVASVQIARNELGSAVQRCVAQKVRRWVFPQPRDERPVKVRQVLTFTNGSKPSPALIRERVPRLEEKLQAGTLTDAERYTLLGDYVALKDGRRARTLIDLATKEKTPDERARLTLQLLSTTARRRLLAKEFDAATTTLIQLEPADPAALRELADHLIDTDPGSLTRRLGEARQVDPTTGASVLARVREVVGQEAAQALLTAWLANTTREAGYQLLTNDAATAEAFPEQVFETSGALLTKGDPRPDVVDRRIAAALALKRDAEVVDAVVGRCKTVSDEQTHCERWLTALAHHAAAQAVLKTVLGGKIKALEARRRDDVANPALIEELAALLRQVGEAQAADRLLSEVVEFAPHDYQARRRYAKALTGLERPAAACSQMALAVQLNPAERDTFKEMMSLRRSTALEASRVQGCIVEGVSKLPVQRAVSLIMTWEDPSADIDLHITEAGGEHVWYQDRESSSGGLLYYDITDGYGPEIYVLGSGPSGEYKLEVVYYSGDARNVRGTLTILRNAGSPAETREERPFTLPASDARAPLGSFRL